MSAVEGPFHCSVTGMLYKTSLIHPYIISTINSPLLIGHEAFSLPSFIPAYVCSCVYNHHVGWCQSTVQSQQSGPCWDSGHSTGKWGWSKLGYQGIGTKFYAIIDGNLCHDWSWFILWRVCSDVNCPFCSCFSHVGCFLCSLISSCRDGTLRDSWGTGGRWSQYQPPGQSEEYIHWVYTVPYHVTFNISSIVSMCHYYRMAVRHLCGLPWRDM